MTDGLASELKLPCGAVLKNRIGKAPMTEGLADPMNRATGELERLYARWSDGGAGLLVTGNVQVDRRYLERPGNVVIDDNGGIEELKAYARAGTRNGTHLWMQINHPGRQTPRRVNPRPVAPSAVPLGLPESAFAPPRALEEKEIEDIIFRFGRAAAVARETGFTGVQVHAAHGYLLSQFLSPLANRREDRWGGSLENRARLLLEVVRTVRQAVGPSFPVSVKLNSSDFQTGGFSDEDCLQVVRWLEEAGVDLLEISGGNYEQPSMMAGAPRNGEAPKESTVKREAYFLDYAERLRAVSRIPLMVSGGFRSRAAMDAALASGALDMVGVGRPMCVETDMPGALLEGRREAGGTYEASIRPAKGALGWFCLQLIRIGRGLEPDTAMTGEEAITRYLDNENATADALRERRLD